MAHEFEGGDLALDTQFPWEEHGEVPLVVIKGEDGVEELSNDTLNTWNVSAPEDRTEAVPDHLQETETSLGTLATYGSVEAEEGPGVDGALAESEAVVSEVVIVNEDSGLLPEQAEPLRSLVSHSEDSPVAEGMTQEEVIDSGHEMVTNVPEELPETEAKEAHVGVDVPEADDSEHSPPTQEGVDDIPPTKPPHTTEATDSGDEEPEKKADHQQSQGPLTETNREPEDIAALDTIIDYEAAARELGKRQTSNPVWVEACVSTLNQPGGTNTARLAYSIGQDHNTVRTALSGMAALGLASETGRVAPDNPPGVEGTAVGRPTREFRPEPALEHFVRDYNDLRYKVLAENLPEQLQDRTPAQLEQQALATYASAHQETFGRGRPLTPDVIAARLGVNREAVRYYAFNSFAAAHPGVTQVVSYELGREIRNRRQQRAEAELPVADESNL